MRAGSGSSRSWATSPFPRWVVWGEYAAVAAIDARASRTICLPASKGNSNLDYAATKFIWGGGRLADAWPATPEDDEYDRVRTSSVETLLVSGELDFAAPPQAATKSSSRTLPNGQQVVLPGIGHSPSFWTQQTARARMSINTYFDTGRVDDSRYKPQPVDFTPEVTQAALGKGIAGAMVGLAALTVLSILWLAVRRKPRFGRKTSPILRSLYAIVLGLGGWFAGVLLVIDDDAPARSLDDRARHDLRRLAGRPRRSTARGWIAAGRRGRSSTASWLGVGGASLGAWLGFHAATDLLALLTSIVGAIAVGEPGPRPPRTSP